MHLRTLLLSLTPSPMIDDADCCCWVGCFTTLLRVTVLRVDVHGARRGRRGGGTRNKQANAYGLCDGALALAQQSVFNAQVEQSLCFVLLQSFFLLEFIIILEHNQLEISPFFSCLSPHSLCSCLSILETIVSTIVFVCVAKKTNKKKRKRDPIKS